MNIFVACKKSQYENFITTKMLEKLKSLGTTSFASWDTRPSEEEYSAILKKAKAEIVVTNWESPKITMKVYRDNPQLKYLCHLAGTIRGHIDKEVIEAGMLVTNWGGMVGKSVAEAALMMILGALRRSTHYQFEFHLRKGWHGNPGYSPESLFRQRVGLHGFGYIAQDLVRLIQPFDCKVSALSPHCPDEVFKELKVKRVNSLKELFASNRIISIHASKIASNYHIINKDIIAELEDGGVIVNTARASVMDTEALIAELKTGRICAALDVFEVEPLEKESGLRGLENCMLIPHIGGPTEDWYPEMGNIGVLNIENFIKGREVIYTVSPEKYDLIT